MLLPLPRVFRISSMLGLSLGLAAFALSAALAGAEPPANGKDSDALKPAPAVQPTGIPVPNLPVIKTTTLEGGLVIEDLKLGTGPEIKPGPGSAVVAHYQGTFKDPVVRECKFEGEFDSSYRRGEPLALPLANVIPGWQKGVPGMKVGGIRRLIVPSALAYGEKGAGDAIPPNADLVFIIEVVDALQVEDTTVGEGEEATAGAMCITAYTMKTADGKVIESATRTRPFAWLPREHMGVSVGMVGMKVGGKRTIRIPAAMNLPAPPAPDAPRAPSGSSSKGSLIETAPKTPARPSNVPLIVEVELMSVRNNPPLPKPNGPDDGC